MPETLGQVLRKARERHELTLRDVESRTGIHNAHVSQIETGKILRPELSKLWKLTELYGLDQDEVLELAGYGEPDVVAGQRRAAVTYALRALEDLTPSEQAEAMRHLEELRQQRER